MGSISLQGIGKVFSDGTVAVKDVDLDIDDGEFVVLVGPSGCGKTTLLRMIAGLESISSGQLRFDNDVINEVSARDRNFAMVFQNYALYPHMTVWQNIAFPLRVHKFPKSEIDQRVREAARILDLSELLERKPKQLSGGQRQRVAMGRAIVRHPGVFLLDEPLSNLDAKLRVQLRAELGRLHARLGVTTIHVTHDQVEAMTLGNRVAVFSKGTLQQYDTPNALYHRPANVFVAGFIGSPAMNFLEARLIEAGDEALLSIGSARVSLGPLADRAVKSGERLLVGIRPEHLAWRPPGDDTPGHLRASVVFVEHLEPESYVSVSLTDPAAAVRAADEYIGDGADGSAYLADEEVHLVTLRVPADAVPERGAVVDIVIDAERARLFSASTGESL